MGFIIAIGQEAATAAQRVYEIFDTEPAITDPAESGGGPLDGPACRWTLAERPQGRAHAAAGKPRARSRAARRRRRWPRALARALAHGQRAGATAAARRAARLARFDQVAFSYPGAPARCCAASAWS